MSHQSKTYHGQSSVLLFQPLVDKDTAHISADFLCHHISSLEKQRDKLDIIKVKNWPFYLSNFTIIKKLVVVFLMVVLVVFVLLC